MKEYYKIGEISALYGIGTDSLRYYEEIGILKPHRDNNGYRMYGIGDIRTLNILRDLRTIGFSMEEIKNHLADFDLAKTLALFQQEISVIDEKMLTLQNLKSQLTDRISEIESHRRSAPGSEQPHVEVLPVRKILKLSERVYRDEDLDFVIKKLQKEHESHLYLIGNSRTGATIPLDFIEKGHYGHFNSAFCIVDKGSFDTTLPAGKYLCATCCGSYQNIPAAWKNFFIHMKKSGYTAESDPLELYMIDNHDTNCEDEYITQLQVKIRG
ncbi:MerR family transcriptional regulator [Anaerovoracaceae bacterium 41-7]|jgi:DNA-binding transcriptional MerR regulator|uniref:MerR family transcriptional regulator n=1 Tax=Anaerotruncus colihominis TaxID=169435 RepID=A0A845QF61_9FIRM|nr:MULTISPECIES: MerR family transcriptional regulator [Clostridia]MCI9639094.1 MerR family transcriptional regulator [Emergencia sp.]NBH60412.1 MerR family transcriptional regulator [Anaerotruncus colihominis]NCE99248.1 MerR family transcriptional regulator [Emergencia sp. 1XD21-10]NCF01066.1 MerR family transcriptional regulator [Anaerotruncus sp. 80]